MLFDDVTHKNKCTPTTGNQKRWTLTTANRMLRHFQEDIENTTRVPVGDDLSYNESFLKRI